MNKFTQRSRDWRTVSPLYQKMLMLLLLMVVSVSGAWAQLVPSTRYNLENVGSNSFALVNLSEGKVICKSSNQDIAYQAYADAFGDETKPFEFKLVSKNGHYLLKAYYHNGNEFANEGYLNSQSSSGWNVSFIMGLNNQDGQDGPNLALWDLESDGNGAYKLKNVGTGKYLNDNHAALNDNGVSWSLCAVGAGCKVEFYSNNNDWGTVTAKRLDTNAEITSGTNVPCGTKIELTAHPNSGYAFNNWSNGETGLTRVWTVTASGSPTGYFKEVTEIPFSVSCDWGGSDYTMVLAPTSADAGFPPFSVFANDAKVDASQYTFSYTVKSGPISINNGKVTVDSNNEQVKGLENYYSNPNTVSAVVTVTATPKTAGTYVAGSVDLNIVIKPVTNASINLNPTEVRIGESFDLKVSRKTGFPNIKYYWSFPEGADQYIWGYNGTAVEQTNTDLSEKISFMAKAPTSGKMDIYLRVESDASATEYVGLWGNGVTIKPITKPTITQDGGEVKFTYEEDYGNVDAFLEYFIGTMDEAHRVQKGFDTSDGRYTATDIPANTKIYAKSVIRYLDPDGNTRYTASDVVEYTTHNPLDKIEVNGTEREYFVYAPDGISGNVGVVLSLHGASNDFDNGRVDFNAIADAEKNVDNKKFVVVYPRGLMRQLRGTERGWDSYTEDGVEDVEFFKAVVKKINDDNNGLTVDMNRVYLAGFSNGGMMAYKAAHQAGDFFKAFASVGGFPVNESHLFHAGVQPTPFVHIHGKADGVIPISTYNINAIVHNMVYRNGAQFNPNASTYEQQDGGMVNSDKVEKDCHAAAPGGAAYYMYKVADMGHTWTYDWNNDGKDDIAATMWAFFNKSTITNNVDPTLKFRLYDTDVFWGIAGSIGFDNVNTGKSVLSYGGHTYDAKNNNANKNVYHSLQFQGGINGAPHFLKLSVETELVQNENPNQFFLVKLTKTGETVPVFAKRYQAGRGAKDLYINFAALPGFNEYKLEITKSSEDLVVKVHGVETHSGKCQDVGATENPTAFYDVATVLAGMNPIYQPVFGKTYDGIAKEHLPIADIPVGGDPKIIADALKVAGVSKEVIPSTLVASTAWDADGNATVTNTQFFNLAVSGKDGEETDVKVNNACILSDEAYTVNRVNGINLSQHGRAEMPEYLNGTRGAFPTKGVIAIKVEGTLDFTVLAQSKYKTDIRRTLKVYYTNDQLDGELKELKEWWFYGDRTEVSVYPLSSLGVSIRLPQLGKDGTCTVFVTYEGDGRGSNFSHKEEDNDEIWIKGFVIKRPDLKVTIGRTDSKYSGQTYNGENNTFCTRFGENKPYIWSLENVGFNNTKNADLNEKKVNVHDGRTYICGGTDDSWDHLLVYSDITHGDGEINKNDKAQFDGRQPGNEHIEFHKPSVYDMVDADREHRRLYDPIHSNGLKVNVTGSGWFKIKCSAPNGPVNMKVYTQTNYGTSYISLLREFKVEKTATDIAWDEYTVYLKSRVNREVPEGTNQIGSWDGHYAHSYDEGAEEILRQSLFVVFDKIEGVAYEENDPQLNIHQLSWLNEEPADYVFQREEDPKIISTWQEIKRNGETVLWWKGGNDDDVEYPVLKENNQETYDVTGQFTTKISDNMGVKSPGGYASTSVPSDAGTYDAYWDISARPLTNAHTEKAYANKNTVIGATTSPEYVNVPDRGNTEFDIPISGSFIRICAMKNTYVVAHVLPCNVETDGFGSINGAGTNGTTAGEVYVLDETGAPIPYKPNGADLDEYAKKLGYITAMQNFSGGSAGGAKSNLGTMRIDFTANAGKEYFICAKNASISLARLEVHDWRYKPTKSSETLALVDNADNADNIADAYDTEVFYRDATLTRTFAANKWASLVLPFSLNEKKFEEVFGEGAQCLHFTEVDKDAKKVYLTHHYYNMIVAGRPVFVRPAKDVTITNPVFNDVTLQAKEVRNTTTAKDFEFVASYDKTPISKYDLYMNNDNAIKYQPKDGVNYPGMRSFIKSPAGFDPTEDNTGSSTGGAKAMFLNFDDADASTATGIEELISEEFGDNVIVVTKSTKVYDLKGRMVADGADIDNLPAGIYVVNGKKFVVK